MFFQGTKLRPMISTTCMTPGREYGVGSMHSGPNDCSLMAKACSKSFRAGCP